MTVKGQVPVSRPLHLLKIARKQSWSANNLPWRSIVHSVIDRLAVKYSVVPFTPSVIVSTVTDTIRAIDQWPSDETVKSTLIVRPSYDMELGCDWNAKFEYFFIVRRLHNVFEGISQRKTRDAQCRIRIDSCCKASGTEGPSFVIALHTFHFYRCF